MSSSSAPKSSTYTLNTKTPLPASPYSIPILGYGVYQTPSEICESVVTHALKTGGYRHIDSARVYRNEAPCASAILKSGIDRSEIFFTSKIGPRDMGYEKAKASIDGTFREIEGLEYVDLMLVHAPYGGAEARKGTWRALVEAQRDGRVRSIGVSNYGVHHLEELKGYIADGGEGGIVKGSKIDVGQWEIHPWLPREDIVGWARENGVVIQAWSPLVRSERADEEVLGKIGKKHGKTWAQVLIRWSLQKGFVPLPKSVTLERIEQNRDVFDFELDEQDMRDLYFPDSYAPCSWDPTTSKD